MHQRTCGSGLSQEIAAMNDERYEVGEVDITESISTEHPERKPGIKLPKSDSEWASSEIFSG